MLSTQIVCHPGATLEIGDESTFNYGVSIDAAESIRIGRRCLVASMVRISDASAGQHLPVTIGEDVWIAHSAILEPGVTIGNGSVIAAGSVVTRDVPPRSLAIGNPARSMALEVRA
jgi:maltose O-acetyltransferase